MESKALSNILERNSPRQLIEPHPNAEEMKLVYEAALRAPDHGWIRPIHNCRQNLCKISLVIDYFWSSNLLQRFYSLFSLNPYLNNLFFELFNLRLL